MVVAFEVVEHVDLYAACQDLLKPNGKLLVTTPAPHADWFMKILELVGLIGDDPVGLVVQRIKTMQANQLDDSLGKLV